MNKTRFIIVLGILFLFCFSTNDMLAQTQSHTGVPRISIDGLKKLLGSHDLILIDVRSNNNWSKSNRKITRALREDPRDVVAWLQKYPKEKMIVLY